MEIRCKYTSDEVEKIVLAHHEKTFGPPPAGYKWGYHSSYGDHTVENEEIPTFAAEPETPMPGSSEEKDPF